MLGVLKRRWRPKRASGNQGKPESPPPCDVVVDKNRTASSPHQIHPLCDDKSQLLAYETLTLQSQSSADVPRNHSPALLPPYANPLVANICVEGGRIEFIKSPSDFGNDQKATPTPTLERVATVSRAQQTQYHDEKSDFAKEILEARVLELEQALEREQSNGVRERLSIAKLQRQLARREVHQRDVDRERRLRLDTETRLRDSSGEADKHRTRLASLQGEISRMEETVRSMLQFKARNEVLKQEKTSLTVAYESRIHQFQNSVTKLNQENEALKKQLRHCEATDATEVQSALLERIQALETDNCSLTREAELQRRQYERCLDDVANKVVRALLSQKALREEIGGLQRRIVELETQNRALTSVLVQQFQDGSDVSRSLNMSDERQSFEAVTSDQMTPSGFSPDTPGTSISTPSTNDIAEEHALVKSRLRHHQVLDQLWDDSLASPRTSALLTSLTSADPVLWLPLPRPRSLDLGNSLAIALAATPSLGKCKRRLSNGEKTLEDSDSPGNRDEGYSTMSSDVQDPLRPEPPATTTRGLEDLKEETDLAVVTVTTPGANKVLVVDPGDDATVVYIPLVALGLGSNRHSFPPSRNVLPFQHIMRSFSDSHLCLKFMTSPNAEGHSTYSISSATSSTPSILVMTGGDQKHGHPLRRTKGVNLLSTAYEGDEHEDEHSISGSWCSGGEMVVEGCWWDADYVQHWLKLDDTRTTMQQQHRDMLEYDHTELEDWSMSLSSEDIAHEQWRKSGSVVESLTPNMLPSIQEHNALELEEDASECLWNNSSYLMDRPGGELMTLLLEGDPGGLNLDSHWPYGGSGTNLASNFCLASPGGSWSSSGTSSDCCHSYDCSYNCQAYDSKRSSAALSDDATETHAIGTDFTRDFYRLVKFESTKSLASTSSRSQVGDQGGSLSRRLAIDQATMPKGQEREQALQSVLHFIAEQQQYCASREEADSGKELNSSRPSSFFQDDSDINNSCTASRVSSGEFDSCSFVKRDEYETNSFQNDSHPTESAETSDCPHASDASTCVPSPPNNSRDNNARRENEIHEAEEVEPSESDGSIGELLLDADAVLETQICTIIQVHTQGEAYSQENELQHSSNNSGKLTEVIHNEHNTFTKHLQNKAFFPGADVDKRIDMKGLLVKPDFHPLERDRGVKSSASTCDVGVCLSTGSTQTDTQGVSVASQHDVDVESEPTANKLSTKSNSEDSSFEKCKIKSASSSLVVEPRSSFLPVGSRINDVLVTVIEETEDEHQVSSFDSRLVSENAGNSVIGFHERATSKDVIEELNRMIRKGEEGNDGDVAGVSTSRSRLDAACCCPTGWVHVERDIDFTDPKARANLLDVMLASSDSSVNSSSSSDSGDEPADYQRLHRLHRFRRQKKASATREQLGVLRCPAGISRPSIIGRDDFFVRYGDKERDAVASFDFLEDISTTSVSGTSSCDTSIVRARPPSPTLDVAASPSSDESDARTGSGGQISLSDSCAASFSGSSTSLENQAQ